MRLTESEEFLMAKRILCIEDEAGLRMMIRLMLENAGYEIFEAADGKEGLDHALKIAPDLIVCDIRMPGMDGFEVLEQLRKHEATAQIPFVFLTGEDPRTNLRKGMNLGANDFILKPINEEDLIKAVQVRMEESDRRKNESQLVIDELSLNITRALPHELRTPMTGIMGLAELLQSQADEMTPQEIKEHTQLLLESAVRMNQTLDKLWIHTQCLLLQNNQAQCAVSRQTGTKEADRIINTVAEGLASAYKRSSDLLLNLYPMSIAISEQYLEQVLWQVIDNAFKFSDAGMPVKIASFCVKEIGMITLKDHGRGMTENQIKKTNMFIQFDRERYEQQGLGLGLMIAKRLTEIHGGNIRVISTQAKGTTVTISFPLL
jgi:two-component system sensor histidine kinase/response regulator